MSEPIDYPSSSTAARRIRREQYVVDQGGRCWYCTAPLEGPTPPPLQERYPIEFGFGGQGVFPPGFLTFPVHLHHDHKTGQTIGAVHAYCNAILWVRHGE